MLALLAEIVTVMPASGTSSVIRMAWPDDPSVCTLNSVEWKPALRGLDGISLSIFDPEFSGSRTGVSGSLTFDNSLIDATSTSWASAPVKIYTGKVGDAWGSYSLVFSGAVEEVGVNDDGVSLARLRQADRWLDNPVLTATYAGTTGAEGPAALKGTPKPFCWGQSIGVEPILIDAANNVYQFHGYGSAQAVSNAQVGGSDLTATSDYASYAALVAASVPRGKYATCLASGMVRLGAPPNYPLTLNVSGDNGSSGGFIRRAGAVITRLAGLAGAVSGNLDATSLSALDTAVTGNTNHYLTQQVSARSIIQALASGANATAVVGLDGRLFVTRPVVAGTSSLAYYSDGEPIYHGAANVAICGPARLRALGVPYWKLSATAERTYRVLAPGEIAFTADLVDRGDYNGSTTYREGEQVRASDGNRYQYTATTPTSGNAPPNGTYWALIEAKPTITNVTGAGALASQNTVTWASQVTGLGKPADNATFGATWNSNITGQPSETLMLNSSQSFTTSGGQIYWNPGTGWVPISGATLAGLGAGSLATANVVTSALIGTAAVGSLHVADAAITSAKVSDLESDNWASSGGAAGWKIYKSGSATFNGVVLSRDQRVADSYYYPSWYTGGAGDYTWRTYWDDWIDTGVSPSVWDFRGPLVANARLDPATVYSWGGAPVSITCEVSGIRDYVAVSGGASNVQIRVRVEGYNANMGTPIYFTVYKVT